MRCQAGGEGVFRRSASVAGWIGVVMRFFDNVRRTSQQPPLSFSDRWNGCRPYLLRRANYFNIDISLIIYRQLQSFYTGVLTVFFFFAEAVFGVASNVFAVRLSRWLGLFLLLSPRNFFSQLSLFQRFSFLRTSSPSPFFKFLLLTRICCPRSFVHALPPSMPFSLRMRAATSSFGCSSLAQRTHPP